MTKVIDLEEKKLLKNKKQIKQINDEYMAFLESVEKHFNYDDSENAMFNKIMYCLRLLENLCVYTFKREKILLQYKNTVISLMKLIIEELQECEE